MFLEKKIGDVCAKTRRYPRTRTTEKFRKFGDVNNADVWLNKLPNPTIATKLSLVMVFAGGWRDVIDEKVLCVMNWKVRKSLKISPLSNATDTGENDTLFFSLAGVRAPTCRDDFLRGVFPPTFTRMHQLPFRS